MQITRTEIDGKLHLSVVGRLDGYWADHLESVLSQAVREGHHHVRAHLSQVSFLSSAGIGTLMKCYKELDGIGGSFKVVDPSAPVRLVLELTHVSTILMAEGSPVPAPYADRGGGRTVERAGLAFEAYDLPKSVDLRCRALGREAPLATASFLPSDGGSLGSMAPLFALGVGAFGEGFTDCRARCGELVSIVGATAYQPADGTNVPDYLLASGPLPPEVWMLYGLVCEGSFARLLRFEARGQGTVGMLALLESLIDIQGDSAIGFVMVSETAGLIGAALRRSPAQPMEDGDLFAHPGVRGRLSFTAERAFPRSVTVSAGVLVRDRTAGFAPCVRPIGAAGLMGHVHAAAFPYRPLRKGEIPLKETVTSLFEAGALLGVLHLLHDDRGASGAGESEFIRGACWVGPIVGDGRAAEV